MPSPSPSIRPGSKKKLLLHGSIGLLCFFAGAYIQWMILASPYFHFPFLVIAGKHPRLYLAGISLVFFSLPILAAYFFLRASSSFPGTRQPIRSGTFYLLQCLLLSLWLLFSMAPALFHEFELDDLFLLRSYTLSEILSAFTGAWDTTHTLTESYRPVSTIYLHIAHALCGETPLLYRLLNVTMLATGSVLIIRSVSGEQNKATSILALLLLCTSNSLPILTAWLIQGFRCFQILLIGLSLTFLRRATLKSEAHVFALSLSLLCFGGAMLIREESVGAIPF